MTSYTLASNGFITKHADHDSVALLHDLAERPMPTDIEVMVASGDLFAELATELDSIALSLTDTSGTGNASRLDKLTEILLYLQRNYHVTRK
jgi:soluble P-type ATPase